MSMTPTTRRPLRVARAHRPIRRPSFYSTPQRCEPHPTPPYYRNRPPAGIKSRSARSQINATLTGSRWIGDPRASRASPRSTSRSTLAYGRRRMPREPQCLGACPIHAPNDPEAAAQPCESQRPRTPKTRMVAGVRGGSLSTVAGRGTASQAEGRGFEPHRPLHCSCGIAASSSPPRSRPWPDPGPNDWRRRRPTSPSRPVRPPGRDARMSCRSSPPTSPCTGPTRRLTATVRLPLARR